MNQIYPQSGAIPRPNASYPMANMQGVSTYAAPLNYNQPKEVISGYDARINPMTGQEIPQTNFARGGNVKPEAGLASLVASRGRGDDKMLVHMTPSEVRGLQALAMAHGGSLTINPDTGLYEAGFLKKLLPTIIGAILTPLSGGLINPFTAGLLVGGVEGIRTGDLGKGLMAGLGAYGGAGLSTALAGAGSAAASTATSEAVKAAGTEAAAAAAKEGANQAAQEAAKQAAMKEAAQSQIQKQIATKGMFGRVPEGVASFKNIGAGIGEIASGGAKLGGIGGMGTAGATFGNLSMPAKAGLTTTAASALSPEMEIPEGQAIDDSYYESGGYDPVAGTFREGKWRKGYPGFPGYASGGEVAHFGMGGASFARNENDRAVREDYSLPRNFTTSEYGRSGFDQRGVPNAAIQRAIAAAAAQPKAPVAQAAVNAAPSPPKAPGGITSTLGDYMSQLNQFVASPISAPQPASAPNTGVIPPGSSPTPTAGGIGGMKWDPTQGRFVDQTATAGNINFGGIPFGSIGDMGMYGSMYGDVNGYTSPGYTEPSMTWDPSQGQFTTPAAPAAPAAPVDTSINNPFAGTGINFSGIGGAGSYNPPAYQPPAEPTYQPPVEPTYQPPQEPIYQQEPFAYVPEQQTYYREKNILPDYIAPEEQLPSMMRPEDQIVSISPIERPDYVDRGAPVREFLDRPYMPIPEFDYTRRKPSYVEPVEQYEPQPVPSMRYEDLIMRPQFENYREPVYAQPEAPYMPTYEYEPPVDRDFVFDSGNAAFYAGGGSVEYAAAGKLLRGPGDGMSDDIKANISGKQEARLADGEFVIPADVVSHLGNGSSEAGSRKLYKMMADIRKARTGRKQQAPAVNVDKHLPA